MNKYSDISPTGLYAPQLAFIGILIALNLFVAWIVRTADILIVSTPNTQPFGDIFGPISSTIIVGFVTLGLWRMKLFASHTIPSSLILAGIWSNYLEYWIFNQSVSDYLPMLFGLINLADIQIWLGLIWLNYRLWFDPSTKNLPISNID